MSGPPTSLPSSPPGTAELAERQREHYDRIIAEYEAHYDDPMSQRYRRRFLYEPLFRGLDLRGRNVLEAMCGTGQATGFLQERGARVTGLDLSGGAIELFRQRWPDAEAVQASVLESGLPGAAFDGVVVIGGLHHVHPHVQTAVDELHRVLRPGGWLAFMEPHTGSLPDVVRRWWYRRDAMFEEGEAAIDIDALRAANADRFDVDLLLHVGSVAYMLVLNSLILRIPRGLKRYYAPPLFLLEQCLKPLHGSRTACIALGRWRKRSTPPRRHAGA